jgi:Eukaryotic aspartyl protease
MGMAPDIHAGFAKNTPYSLVLNSLQAQGVIGSRVFTLDLRHQDDVGGAIIYGGLDKGRFTGALTKVPLVLGDKGEFR